MCAPPLATQPVPTIRTRGRMNDSTSWIVSEDSTCPPGECTQTVIGSSDAAASASACDTTSRAESIEISPQMTMVRASKSRCATTRRASLFVGFSVSSASWFAISSSALPAAHAAPAGRVAVAERRGSARAAPSKSAFRSAFDRRRIECLHARRNAPEALHLDERVLAGAALREARRADVARENVRVPVDAGGDSRARVLRVEPGAGRELDDARPDVVGDDRAREAAPAVVEQPDDVAARDPARRGVARVDADGLAAADLGRLAVRAVIELAVEARRGVVRDEREREARGGGRTEPLVGLQPCRVTRAVAVAEGRDRLREELDLAARRAEGRTLGVGAERVEQNAVGLGVRDRERARLPEPVEGRCRDARLLERGGELGVEPHEPRALVEPLGERVADPEPLREAGEDLVVALRLACGLEDLVHRDDARVGAAGADVVPLE